MKTILFLFLGVAIAADPPFLQRLKKQGPLTEIQEFSSKSLVPPAEDAVYGICLSVPFLHAQAGFNEMLGIDPAVSWRQASTIDRLVNNIIFNNGTQGLLQVCSARQLFAYTLGASYPWCVNRFYLLGQGNTDINNCMIYVHIYKHLEFICSAAFEAYEYNLACIKQVWNSPANNNCFSTFYTNVTADPNNMCPYTNNLMGCIQNLGNTMCDVPTGWMLCERERVGFAYDCPNLQCKVPGQQ